MICPEMFPFGLLTLGNLSNCLRAWCERYNFFIFVQVIVSILDNGIVGETLNGAIGGRHIYAFIVLISSRIVVETVM